MTPSDGRCVRRNVRSVPSRGRSGATGTPSFWNTAVGERRNICVTPTCGASERSMATRTGAERYFEKQRENPEHERAYQEAAATVRAIDELVRSIDLRREERGLSK